MTTLVPTYRRPQQLERAVRSALAQTHRDLEVHIFDNASGDQTEEVAVRLQAEDPRVRYLRRPSDVGAAENFRLALESVRTPFFSFLSDDDELLPDFSRAALTALEAAPTALFAVTRVVHIDAEGRRLAHDHHWLPGAYRPPAGLLKMAREGHPNWTGILYRRELVERIGGIDARAGMSADMDFQLRAAAAAPFVVIATEGARYTHHESAASGGAKLDSVWPCWLTVIEHVATDRNLDPAVRDRAASVLRRRLVNRLIQVGVGSARRGRFEESAEAARVLRVDLSHPRQALIVSGLATACRRLPPIRGLLGWIALRRRRYEAPGPVEGGP